MEILLANAGDSENLAQNFLAYNQIRTPTILDLEEEIYSFYARDESTYAPFPLQVVIDQEGVIQYMAFQHDLGSAQTVIDRLLEDN